MDAARVVLVALLCCLASLGGVYATELDEHPSGMSVVHQNGTAEYLAPAPGDVDRTGQRTTSLDVAAAVGSNAGEVRITYRQAAIDRNYRDAETVDERRAVIRNGTEAMTQRVDRLERKEREAVQRYSDGEMGETELLRTLAIVHREAVATESTLSWLETRAERLGMDETEGAISVEQIRLVPLQGPVRASVDESLDGERDVRVHVDTSGRGIVLASMDETPGGEPRYVREANDPTAKTVNIEDRYGGRLAPAEERIEELYPWVADNGNPSVSLWGPPQVRLYRFTYAHPHGELDLYLDSGSADVLQETQLKDPELVPTDAAEVSEANLQMTVETTRAGGPLGVTVTDASTGEPVDADVAVDNRTVGSTGGETFWSVAPRGDVTVNATYRGETLRYDTTLE